MHTNRRAPQWRLAGLAPALRAVTTALRSAKVFVRLLARGALVWISGLLLLVPASAQNINVQADNTTGLLWRPSTFFSNTTNAAAIASALSAEFVSPATLNGYFADPSTNGSFSASAWKTDLSLSNVENTALSTWAGSTNLTTLGTIATGTWNATAIADGKIAAALTGKTYNGLTLTSTTGTLTITNAKTFSVSNTLTLAGTDGSTLNVGAGGTLGTGAFQPQTVLTGTANQITVSNGGVGATTLSLPQSIATTSAVRFGSLGVGVAAGADAGTIRANVGSSMSSVAAFRMEGSSNDTGNPPNHFPLFELGNISATNNNYAYFAFYDSAGAGTYNAFLLTRFLDHTNHYSQQELWVRGSDGLLKRVTISGTPASTSTTTGALQVSGGIGVTGRTSTASLNVGGTNGSTIDLIASNSATLDFGSIDAAASADLTITVTGASTGDSVALGLPAAPTAGIIFNGFVSATNTVTVRAFNVTGSPVDPASATYRATVTSF